MKKLIALALSAVMIATIPFAVWANEYLDRDAIVDIVLLDDDGNEIPVGTSRAWILDANDFEFTLEATLDEAIEERHDGLTADMRVVSTAATGWRLQVAMGDDGFLIGDYETLKGFFLNLEVVDADAVVGNNDYVNGSNVEMYAGSAPLTLLTARSANLSSFTDARVEFNAILTSDAGTAYTAGEAVAEVIWTLMPEM